MENIVNNNVVNILLPEDNSCEQHIHEIGLFLYKKEDKTIKNNKECFIMMGLNFDTISDYDLFLAMWLIFKSLNNYTESVALSFNIWDNKMTLIDNEVVLVDRNGNIVMNENLYHSISDVIREKFKGLIL